MTGVDDAPFMIALRHDDNGFSFLGFQLVWSFSSKVILHNGVHSVIESDTSSANRRRFNAYGLFCVRVSSAEAGGDKIGPALGTSF